MAVLVRSEVPGLTQELYDRLIAEFEPKVKQAPGFVSHVAGPIPGGWAVTEIWETPEQFNAWITATVMPTAMAAGMNAPIITMTPLHHVISK
jgi:heme-degrading monooxygenase HmoA